MTSRRLLQILGGKFKQAAKLTQVCNSRASFVLSHDVRLDREMSWAHFSRGQIHHVMPGRQIECLDDSKLQHFSKKMTSLSCLCKVAHVTEHDHPS